MSIPRRITRHYVGSSAIAPIVLDSSSSDNDDEPAIISANKSKSNVEVVKLSDNIIAKSKSKSKSKSNSNSNSNSKTKSNSNPNPNHSTPSQIPSKSRVTPKSAHTLPLSLSLPLSSTSTSQSHKRRKLREDNLDLDSVLQASKEINRVVRNQKSERKLASASTSIQSSSSTTSLSSANFTSPSIPSQSIRAQDEKTPSVSHAAQPAQPAPPAPPAPPAQNGASRDTGTISSSNNSLKNNSETLSNALNIPIKKKTIPLSNKPIITKFDPRIHKPYKDLYDTFCITCEKKGRSDFCNRQKPCDICVGKKVGGCSYPPTAKIIVPATIKSRFSKGPINNTNNNNNNVILHKLKLPKKVTIKRFASNSDIRKALKDADNKRDNFNKSSLPSPLPTPIPSSKNQIKEFVESEDDQININNNSDNSELDISSDDYNEDIDDNDDNDEGDDDYDRKIERRRLRTARERKARNGNNINMDSFEQTQRILQELEFEKRDVNEIYTLGRRRRREATRENYKLPSEDDESDSNLDDGYAIAEARNEQIILSEDEEEKRFLRGELTMDYIREKEKKQRKQIVSESSSEDDFEL